jgi:hypothetical protein
VNVKILIGSVFEKSSYLILVFVVCGDKKDMFYGSKSLRLANNIERLVTAFIKIVDIEFSEISLVRFHPQRKPKYYK